MQKTINLARQLGDGLGAAAVLLGLVKIVSDLEDNRNLGGESAGAANILLRDARAVEAIEHGTESKHLPVRPEQRDR